MRKLLFISSLLIVTSSARAQSLSTDVAHIDHCIVSLDEDKDVAAQEAGVLVELGAGDGDIVRRDSLLAQIDDEQPQLQKFAAERELRAALTKADSDIEVKFAEASHQVAAKELENNQSINARNRGTVPTSEIRRLELAENQARLQIEKSQMDRTVARMEAEVKEAEVKASEAAINRRRVLSPIEGMVVEVKTERGEWVDAGEVVMRVVRMDRLRVEGLLDASQFDPAQVGGQPVAVEIEMAQGRLERFTGQIVYVNPILVGGVSHRVRALVKNRRVDDHWLLRPGMKAKMAIRLKSTTAAQ